MCGRFALYSPRSVIARRYLGIEAPEGEDRPRYNIAPGTPIAIVTTDANGKPVIRESMWGFHPGWADEKAPTPINAKAETVATSRYFRNAFAHRRGLIPADGWYEWRLEQGRKEPYFIHRRDSQPLMFAGIWEPGREQDQSTAAIITQPAQPLLASVHPRMPAVLDPESYEDWLDPELTNREIIRAVIRPLPQELLEAYRVSTAVNRSSVDDPRLIEPI